MAQAGSAMFVFLVWLLDIYFKVIGLYLIIHILINLFNKEHSINSNSTALFQNSIKKLERFPYAFQGDFPNRDPQVAYCCSPQRELVGLL